MGSDFLVYLSDVRTDVLLDPEGKPAEFKTMQEAVEYGEHSVSASPNVCASIYDHEGRAGDPIRKIYHESQRKRNDPDRRARRQAWTGGILLTAFALWSIYAIFGSQEHFLWFYVVGMKLLVLGSILFVQGVSHLLNRLVR